MDERHAQRRGLTWAADYARDAVHFELPVIRPVDAIQNADKRGFAGTILPHQTVYLTASYL